MTIGNIFYYFLWPLLWFYSPLTARVRVVIRCEDEILVVKNWFGSGHWQLPGGGIKSREKPIDAAIREVNEELNINLVSPELLTNDILVFKQFGLLKRNHFVYSVFKNKPDVNKSREIHYFKWLDINEFNFPQQIRDKL